MALQDTLQGSGPNAGRDLDLYIHGQYFESKGKARLVIRSPATSELLGSAPDATPEDVDAAVASASSAFDSGDWSRLEPLGRNAVLNQIADAFAARMGDFAALESGVTGRPIREMRAQMGRLPEWFRYFGGISCGLEGSVVPFKGEYHSYTQHAPIGVIGLLTPWNHPLLIMVKKLAAALAAGNSIVVKPSELAPLSALLFAELACAAGLPPGVMNVVTGNGKTAGRRLCESPQVACIDFTGGNEAGRHVATAAANRFVPVKLELGGKAPVVIFDDTPLEEAVAGAAFASFIATGQTCVSGARILVQDSIHDQFLAAFQKKIMAIKLGDPSDLATDLGPLISQRQMERALSYIEIGCEEGAHLVCGGRRAKLPPPLEEGFYVEPTVFSNVFPEMRIAREEIFGPVICVFRFRDEVDAISQANETKFGLAASVWTRDVARAHRVASRINAGIVWVNDHHRNDPSSIWGGFGNSGYGKDNGWDALKDYTKKQSVIVRLSDEFSDWFGDAPSKRYG